MRQHDDTFAAFERRFRGIESEIPDLSFDKLRTRARLRARHAMPPLAVGAAVLVLLAIVLYPRALRPAEQSRVGEAPADPSPAISAASSAMIVEPSATGRVIPFGRATWTVMCSDASDVDCDGAVALFTNNLGRSWQVIVDQSGGELSVESRACPELNDVTARRCWDVTAVLPSGAFCMVVASGADDARYPDYFQIGGHDGTGRAGGSSDGRPMCLRSP